MVYLLVCWECGFLYRRLAESLEPGTLGQKSRRAGEMCCEDPDTPDRSTLTSHEEHESIQESFWNVLQLRSL